MERIRGIDERRLTWILLAVAMCVSATWLMIAGQGLTFSGDEIFYYARFVEDHGMVAPGGGLEYFLAPHNGHLVVLGKLIYRGLFLTVGADYTVFRAVEVAGVLTCSGLFFVLARRRVGPWAALIPSVLLLFLGYAGESLLWPFNLHTILALAFGLGALLTLERNDRRGDLATSVLLVLSVATVEPRPRLRRRRRPLRPAAGRPLGAGLDLHGPPRPLRDLVAVGPTVRSDDLRTGQCPPDPD